VKKSVASCVLVVTIPSKAGTQEAFQVLEAGNELRFFEVGRHVGDEKG